MDNNWPNTLFIYLLINLSILGYKIYVQNNQSKSEFRSLYTMGGPNILLCRGRNLFTHLYAGLSD